MMTPVPVAVHRWFERGEGWAFDPRCTALLVAALNVLFDRQLKHPEPGPFLVRTAEGVWVGNLEPDSAALDPHVRPGETPILRAALLPYAPDGELEEVVLRDLARLSPRRPGEDAGLALQVSFGGAPEPARKQRRATAETAVAHLPPRVPRLFQPWLAALLLFSALAVAFTRPWTLLRHDPSAPEPTHAEKMASLLRQWGEAVPDESPDLVVGGFFALLAQPSWAADLDNAHPYHAFIRRLPEKPVAVSDSDEAAVREALAVLLAHLRTGPIPDTFDGLLEALDQTLTYENWWQEQGRWGRYTRSGDRPGKTVRDFVARFRRPEPEVTAVAEKMLPLLEKWRVPGFTRAEARQHPDLVCAAFFQLLRKKDFSYRQLRPNHPDTVFVSRLPDEPLDNGRPLMTAAELRAALNRLARQLDPAFAVGTPAGCLKKIEQEMDYKNWRATEGKGQRSYPDEEQRIDGHVAEFAARFK
jgi:hypothetical protein